MNSNERYTYLLEQISELLKTKDTDIQLRDWRIEALEKELDEAHKTIEALGGRVNANK